MRYKAVKCDICGKDMTNDEHQYKFKRSEYYECSKVWQKLDMCEVCYEDLRTFIAGNNQLRKDGLNPKDKDDIEINTDMAKAEGCIMVREVCLLTDELREKFVKWIDWANANPGKEKSVWSEMKNE